MANFYGLSAYGRTMEGSDRFLLAEEVLARLGSSPSDLEDAEARRRLAEHGPSELEAKRGVSAARLFTSHYKNLMVMVLIIAALISLSMGIVNDTEEEYLDAAVIILIVLIDGVLGFLQGYRAGRAVGAIRELPKGQEAGA